MACCTRIFATTRRQTSNGSSINAVGTIDNYPFGVSVGSVDTFHWWKDGAAYVGYVMPMQQKLRDAAADIRLNNRALEFSYDENGAINGVYAIDAFGDLVQYQAKAVIVATGGSAA